MFGLLLVDKPRGLTSHDVVNRVRRLTRTRRVGHTGTLDPLATGLLILLIGPATRLARFAQDERKSYYATLRLGAETTTYDAEGEIVATHPLNLDRATIEAALAAFRGEIEQRPPRYSAIKVGGEPLYRKARRGESVEAPSRRVTIHQLELVAWRSPFLDLAMTVSKGTYVRSLAHDLGQRLGCGAYVESLRRTAIGPFRLEEAFTLDELASLAETGQLEKALLPPESLIAEMPAIRLNEEEEHRVRHGTSIARPSSPADYLRAHDAEGHLVAILTEAGENRWRPIVVLPRLQDVD